ncbi:GNAT family N-acetyltransferase [Kribbella sp. NPDC004536]|uniref:GNAT family N-acetyltransferase n=1 Tax=Kribbella sp. NPDC004536 TaxID=3364106 RepID=UPI0036C76D6C
MNDSGTISIRTAESNDDLEQWREVRMTVAPGERAATVSEMRAMEHPGRLLLIAEQDGQVVGSGIADDSDLAGVGFVCPRVVPGARRRGVGTALLWSLVEHSRTRGHTVVSTGIDDPDLMPFAERFGFAEVDREIEQIREVGTELDPETPAGVTIVTVAERPELWPEAYHRVYGTFSDLALTSALEVSLEQWNRDWINAPEASFVALVDDQVVGVASLKLDTDHPDRAENGYTAVRREFRGRGIATALKRKTLAWAAAHGVKSIYTWTQTGNDDMRSLNELLGYKNSSISIRVQARLPLARD